MALLGASRLKIARFFGVSPSTLDRWADAEPEFREALDAGRRATGRVARALLRRATGYRVKGVKPMTVPVGGGISEIVDHPVITYYPPDVTAALAWLKRHEPRVWGDAGRGTTKAAQQGGGGSVHVFIDADTAALCGEPDVSEG